jgi:lysophospholipase L1-like esterase
MIWLIVILIVIARLAYVLGRMVFGLKRSAEMLKTAPKQTGTFEVGDPKKPRLRVEILGDSIPAGSGISKFEESFGGYAAAELSRNHRVTLENRAVIGLRMAGLAEVDVNPNSEIALIIIGANDVLRFTGAKSYRQNFEKFLEENSKVRMIITGPGEPSVIRFFPYWLRAYFSHREKLFGKIMTEAAKQHQNVSYTDPQTQLKRVDWSIDGYIGKDKFHPGPKGHKVWFEIIRPALAEQEQSRR